MSLDAVYVFKQPHESTWKSIDHTIFCNRDMCAASAVASG